MVRRRQPETTPCAEDQFHHNLGINTRHAEVIAALRRAALETDGVTEPAVRAAVFAGGSTPEAAESYIAMVRDQSFRISQGAVDDLRSAGLSEDAIFELTVAAALGAADRQLRAGLDLLEGV